MCSMHLLRRLCLDMDQPQRRSGGDEWRSSGKPSVSAPRHDPQSVVRQWALYAAASSRPSSVSTKTRGRNRPSEGAGTLTAASDAVVGDAPTEDSVPQFAQESPDKEMCLHGGQVFGDEARVYAQAKHRPEVAGVTASMTICLTTGPSPRKSVTGSPITHTWSMLRSPQKRSATKRRDGANAARRPPRSGVVVRGTGRRPERGRPICDGKSSPCGLQSAHWYWLAEEADDARSVSRSVRECSGRRLHCASPVACGRRARVHAVMRSAGVVTYVNIKAFQSPWSQPWGRSDARAQGRPLFLPSLPRGGLCARWSPSYRHLGRSEPAGDAR